MASLVLWGHHWDEYQEMFDITASALRGNVLEYGSGPSAGNAGVTPVAQRWISCDALFNLDYPTLKTKAQLIFAEKCDQLRADPAAFDFSRDGGLDAFVQSRQAGMDAFFADYESGLLDAR